MVPVRREVSDEDKNGNDERLPTPPYTLEFNESPATLIEVGPGPYDITRTADPSTYLVVDRLADNQGFGTIKRLKTLDDRIELDYQSMNVAPFGIMPKREEGRGTQVFGVSNLQDVLYIPADTFKAVIGPHPDYAIVTAFNAATTDSDPKKSPALAPFIVYHPDYKTEVQFVITPPPEAADQKKKTITEKVYIETFLGAGGNLGSFAILQAPGTNRSNNRVWSPPRDQSCWASQMALHITR